MIEVHNITILQVGLVIAVYNYWDFKAALSLVLVEALFFLTITNV